uniref:Uncharacterized protein n=1 Tax=Amphimedon queenslandica TaxID=400682 RepID=A0A1X7V8R6_AMPQE
MEKETQKLLHLFYNSINNTTKYGEIQQFAEFPPVGALVFLNVFLTMVLSILTKCGRTCRQVLEEYENYCVKSVFSGSAAT